MHITPGVIDSKLSLEVSVGYVVCGSKCLLAPNEVCVKLKVAIKKKTTRLSCATERKASQLTDNVMRVGSLQLAYEPRTLACEQVVFLTSAAFPELTLARGEAH